MSAVEAKKKPRLATVWLAGCSGCHMSLLDVDEWIIELGHLVDVVFTPIADIKNYPDDVDIALVEGAIANEENREMLIRVRERTKLIVAFGDCAVTGNVTALRNPLGTPEVVLKTSYLEKGDLQAQIPQARHIVPVLLDQVLPLHQVVPIDRYIHGCPPSGVQIREAIEALLSDPALLDDSAIRFG